MPNDFTSTMHTLSVRGSIDGLCRPPTYRGGPVKAALEPGQYIASIPDVMNNLDKGKQFQVEAEVWIGFQEYIECYDGLAPATTFLSLTIQSTTLRSCGKRVGFSMQLTPTSALCLADELLSAINREGDANYSMLPSPFRPTDDVSVSKMDQDCLEQISCEIDEPISEQGINYVSMLSHVHRANTDEREVITITAQKSNSCLDLYGKEFCSSHAATNEMSAIAPPQHLDIHVQSVREDEQGPHLALQFQLPVHIAERLARNLLGGAYWAANPKVAFNNTTLDQGRSSYTMN